MFDMKVTWRMPVLRCENVTTYPNTLLKEWRINYVTKNWFQLLLYIQLMTNKRLTETSDDCTDSYLRDVVYMIKNSIQ